MNRLFPATVGLIPLYLALAGTPVFAQTPICYASPHGNDSNDGSSWALAKAEVMACYDALPHSGGAIYFTDGGSISNPIRLCKPTDPAGCGVWIMGTDPNSAAPPAGWRKSKGRVLFQGEGGSCQFGFVLEPQVCVVGGGRGPQLPEIWLSGVVAHTFRNMFLFSATQPLYVGVDSRLNYSDYLDAASWSLQFENVAFVPRFEVGAGPAVTINGSSMWNFFQHCQFQGNHYEVAKLGLCTRLRGVVTCVGAAMLPNGSASLPSSWTGTMNLGLFGSSDPSFDGLHAASIKNGTTFTFTQNAFPDSSDATGGFASSDAAQGLVSNPQSGAQPGAGTTRVENAFLGGGGFRVYVGHTGGPFELINPLQELGVEPIVEIVGCTALRHGSDIQDAYQADLLTRTAAVWTDAPATCRTGPYVLNSTAQGPAEMAGDSLPPVLGSGSNPEPARTEIGGLGLVGDRLAGEVDDSRRAFGPVATRFVNYAPTAPDQWDTRGQGCGKPVLAVPDPEGGLGAATYAPDTGSIRACFLTQPFSMKSGDTFLIGVWARARNAHGLSSPPLQIRASSPIRFINYDSMLEYLSPPNPVVGGAGEWQWISLSARVAVGGSGNISFFGTARSTFPMDFFAPVMLRIPASTMAESEIAEIAMHLQSYRSDAKIGQASLLPGEQFKADSIEVGDGPTISSGLGAPKDAAAVGSIYLRRDGSPGAILYVYEGGSWKAKL